MSQRKLSGCQAAGDVSKPGSLRAGNGTKARTAGTCSQAAAATLAWGCLQGCCTQHHTWQERTAGPERRGWADHKELQDIEATGSGVWGQTRKGSPTVRSQCTALERHTQHARGLPPVPPGRPPRR